MIIFHYKKSDLSEDYRKITFS